MKTIIFETQNPSEFVPVGFVNPGTPIIVLLDNQLAGYIIWDSSDNKDCCFICLDISHKYKYFAKLYHDIHDNWYSDLNELKKEMDNAIDNASIQITFRILEDI